MKSSLAWFRTPSLRGAWIGLACALVSWLLVRQSFLRGVEDWMLDGCFSLRGKRPTEARVVIIGLDAPSLAALKKAAKETPAFEGFFVPDASRPPIPKRKDLD